MSRLFTLLLSFILAAMLASGDDPAGVGVDLIGTDGGRPGTHDAPAPASQETRPDFPGNARHVLAGMVADPLLGSMESIGYIDFDDEAVDNDSVLAVELNLVLDYAYGDTTSVVLLRLSDMTEDWPPNAPSDTTFTAGPEVLLFSATGEDSLVSIRMPQNWVLEKQDILRDPDFRNLFHGFEFRPVEGNAVLGANADVSAMRMLTATDTLVFPVNKNMTTLTREPAGPLPAGSVLVQDGFGDAVRLDIDFSDVPLGAVNRSILSVPLDNAGLQQSAPPNFVRPLIDLVDLVAIEEDGTVLTSIRASTARDGDRLILESELLVQDIQNMRLGRSSISHFVLVARRGSSQLDPPPFSPADNSVSALLVRTDESDYPYVLLTLTSPE